MPPDSLRDAAEVLFKALHLIPVGATLTRIADTAIVDVNPCFERMLECSRADLCGRSISELNLYVDPADAATISRLVREQGYIGGYEAKIRTKSGQIRDVVLSAQAIEMAGTLHRLVIFHDVTDRAKMETALRDSEERYRALTHSAKDAIVSADRLGNIISWNSGAETIFGYSDAEVMGRPLTILMPERHHGAHIEGLRRFVTTGLSRVIGRTVEVEGRRKDGTEFPLELSLATWKTADGDFFTGILRDISERKDAEKSLHDMNVELAAAGERLRGLLQLDELTGLTNRRGFFIRADDQRKLARRSGYTNILLFIDVDDLKQVNDSFGHSGGDAVLVATADILRDVFRDSDVLARIGGDEFAVLAVNIAGDSAPAIRDRLRRATAAFNASSRQPYAVSFCVGHIVIPPDVVRSVEELLAEADLVMYAEKLEKKQRT